MAEKMRLKILVCAFACLKNPDIRFGFSDGGEGIVGWDIVLQLNRFFDVSVLTHYDNKEAIEGKLAYNKLQGINFYYINLSPFLNYFKKLIRMYAYFWQIKIYFIAKRLHKENNFDVFQHVTYANDWMASYVGALLPIPYIRGPGGGAHFVPKSFLKDYSFKERLAEKIRGVGQWAFRHDPFFIIGQNRARAILVCNKEAFNILPKKWQKKAYLFPVNGVSSEDLAVLNSNTRNLDNIFSVLTVGKLIKIKGFDLAIKAFKIFSEKVSDTKLVIVGKGPEFKKLEDLVFSLGIKDRVIFKGWMSHKEVLEEMVGSDVFLFASLRDGGGAVVVEAMAAGKPVVCFDLAGPGIHIDANCGIKIKPDNPDNSIKEMVKALEKLYADKNLRDKLGLRAMERAEREYSWDKLGSRLKEIYEKTL